MPRKNKDADKRPPVVKTPEVPPEPQVVQVETPPPPPPPTSTASDDTPIAPVSSPVPTQAPTEEGTEEKASTLTIPLTAEGRIAWGAIKRDTTKERIRRVLGDGNSGYEKHQELVGLTKMAPALWMGVQMASNFLIVRRAPESLQDKLSEALAYSKEELEALAAPTAAVLQKYVPSSLGDYSDEINLVMTAGAIHMEKANAVARILEEYKRDEEARKERESKSLSTITAPIPAVAHEEGPVI